MRAESQQRKNLPPSAIPSATRHGARDPNHPPPAPAAPPPPPPATETADLFTCPAPRSATHHPNLAPLPSTHPAGAITNDFGVPMAAIAAYRTNHQLCQLQLARLLTAQGLELPPGLHERNVIPLKACIHIVAVAGLHTLQLLARDQGHGLDHQLDATPEGEAAIRTRFLHMRAWWKARRLRIAGDPDWERPMIEVGAAPFNAPESRRGAAPPGVTPRLYHGRPQWVGRALTVLRRSMPDVLRASQLPRPPHVPPAATWWPGIGRDRTNDDLVALTGEPWLMATPRSECWLSIARRSRATTEPLTVAEAMAVAAAVEGAMDSGAHVLRRAAALPYVRCPSASVDRTRAVKALTLATIGRPVGVRDCVAGLRLVRPEWFA